MKAEPWRIDAACKGMDTEIFYPGQGDSTAEAKAICAVCPVREECKEFALTNREKFGIFGGLSEQERRKIRRNRRTRLDGTPRANVPIDKTAPKSPPKRRDKCGTIAGYSAHYHELPCEHCRNAQSRYSAGYKTSRAS